LSDGLDVESDGVRLVNFAFVALPMAGDARLH
jgi:hypothetical protein